MYFDRIVITGAKGLLGASVFNILNKSESVVRDLVLLDNVDSSRNFFSSPTANDNDDKRRTMVFHFGADSSRVADPASLWRKNLTSTLEVINWVAHSSERVLVFASANSVTPDRTVGVIGGDASPRPRDAYSLSKYLGELLCHAKLPKTNYVVVRLPGLYDQGSQATGLLSRVLDWDDEKQKAIELPFNSGCSILKASEFFVGLLEKRGLFAGQVVNLGFDPPVLLTHDLITSVFGKFNKIVSLDACSSEVRAEAGYIFDLEPARYLGFKPETFNEVVQHIPRRT